MNLHERLPVIGDILGKRHEAAKLLQAYDDKAAKMWETLRASGTIQDGETAVILMYYWDRSMFVIKNGGLHDLIYQPSGFTMDPAVQALTPNDGPFIQIAEESLHDLLLGDHLFVLYPNNEDAQATFAELLDTALWATLPQVKNNRIYFVDFSLNYNDPLTSMRLLDELPKLLGQ